MRDWDVKLKRVLGVDGLAAAVVGSHGRAGAGCATGRLHVSHQSALSQPAFRASPEMSNEDAFAHSLFGGKPQ